MAKKRLSTSIILTRGTGVDVEVFLVERSPTLRFFGGYWAFPGGGVNQEDYRGEAEPTDAVFARCAVRELKEETGLIINGGKAAQPETLFITVCTLVTPPFAPVRFDTRFLHRRLDAGETPGIDRQELIDSCFIKPAAAVDRWLRGEMKIAPPVVALLRLLAGNDLDTFLLEADAMGERLDGDALHPAYFAPGFLAAPLATETLPPATTTNTYIVGTDNLFVVDPATRDPAEQARLFAHMDYLHAQGGVFQAILLTHHHSDHVGGVTALSQRYGLPVRAHALTYERIEPGYLKGEPLHDGERIELGTAPDGSDDWHLTVIHTPGHAVDHLCFMDNRYGAIIAGDMISTVSTILIDPPEGHMQTYLDSLRRLQSLPVTTLLPAHGPGNPNAKPVIEYYLQHRREREQAILTALNNQPRDISALLPAVYNDIPDSAYPVAARSLLAGLIKLAEEGRCKKSQQGWLLTSGGAPAINHP